jgi:hypothetical protein
MRSLVRSSAASLSSLLIQKTRFFGGTWRTSTVTSSTLKWRTGSDFQALRGR